MSTTLKTRNVFLDTEVFVSLKFDFDSSKFVELRKLAAEREIKLLMSETTVQECRKQVVKLVSEAAAALKAKQERGAVGILRQARSLDTSWLWNFDKEAVAKEIMATFDAFLSKSKVTICPLAGVSIEKLFGDYHAGNPPFGQEQKKDQFPDAVAMLSLTKWCSEKKAKAYVLSADGDVKSVCDANRTILLHQNGIAEFLDIFNKTQDFLSETVGDIIAHKHDFITAEIGRKFASAVFRVVGEDGDVDFVTVDSVEVQLMLLIALDSNYAEVELQTLVKFTADVSYGDSSTGYYDNEDGRYYGREFVRKSVERTAKCTADVGIDFDTSFPEGATFVVNLETQTFDVQVGDHYPEYWK